MADIFFSGRPPSVEAYQGLIERVGWVPVPAADARIRLANAAALSTAKAGSQLVGFARAAANAERTYFFIHDVMVEPAYRRKGIASALLASVISTCEEKAAPGAVAALKPAPGMRALYMKLGFQRSADPSVLTRPFACTPPSR